MLLCNSEITANEEEEGKMNDNENNQSSSEDQNNPVLLPVIDTTTRPSSVNNQIYATNSVIEELQVRKPFKLDGHVNNLPKIRTRENYRILSKTLIVVQ